MWREYSLTADVDEAYVDRSHCRDGQNGDCNLFGWSNIAFWWEGNIKCSLLCSSIAKLCPHNSNFSLLCSFNCITFTGQRGKLVDKPWTDIGSLHGAYPVVLPWDLFDSQFRAAILRSWNDIKTELQTAGPCSLKISIIIVKWCHICSL